MADAVAGSGEVEAVLGGERLQEDVVVRVLVVELDDVVVHVLHSQVDLDPLDPHLLQLQARHRAGGVLEQALVYPEAHLLALLVRAALHVILEDLLDQVIGHDTSPLLGFPCLVFLILTQMDIRGAFLLRARPSLAALILYQTLVDRAVLADDLPQLLRGLLVRAFASALSRAGDDFGAGAAGLTVVVGDLGVRCSQAPRRLPVVLGEVGDQVALFEEVRDGPVGQLDGAFGVVHEDSLDLAHALLVAPTALVREGFYLALHTPPALPELPLRLFLGATLLYGPLVLLAKLLACPLALLLSPALPAPAREQGNRSQGAQQDYDHHDDYQQGSTGHGFSSTKLFVWRCSPEQRACNPLRPSERRSGHGSSNPARLSQDLRMRRPLSDGIIRAGI